MKHGLLLVDKPRGLSSHAVVARLRRALATQRIGHAGTLDPMATGLLVLAIGEACKVLRYLTLDDKRYAATVQLGVETDSLDADGAVVEKRAVPAGLDLERVRAAAAEFVGERLQRAPVVSAIKQGGVALHARVRRGELVEAPERRVVLHGLTIAAVTGDAIELELHCGKGFYVRALARDLARALGTAGHLTKLRRLSSGPFLLEDGVPFESIVAAATGHEASRQQLEAAMIPIDRALPGACRAELDTAGAADARHGRPVAIERVQKHEGALEEPIILCDASGTLIALARRAGDTLQVVRGLRGDGVH